MISMTSLNEVIDILNVFFFILVFIFSAANQCAKNLDRSFPQTGNNPVSCMASLWFVTFCA